MTPFRRILIALSITAALLLTIGGATAQSSAAPAPPRPTPRPPARLAWTPKRIAQPIAAGQTLQVSASFVSSANIAEATIMIPGDLGKFMKANNARLTNIKAGVPATVTFTVALPATKARAQSGIVQIRAAGRDLAEPLTVSLTVRPNNDTAPTRAPEPTRTPLPTSTRAPEPTRTPTPSAYPGPTQG